MYIFLTTFVRHGEPEFHQRSVHETDGTMTPKEFGEAWAAEYYAGQSDPEDDGYYFNGGELWVQNRDAREITKEEYDTLKKFLG